MPDAGKRLWLEAVFERSAALGLEARVRAKFEPAVRALVASAPPAPPALGSASDDALLLAMVGLVRALPELGAKFLEALTDVADDAFDDLLREEYATADPLRKLVVHHLREAVRSYAAFGRASAARLHRAGIVGWTDLLPDQRVVLDALPEDGRNYFRGAAALIVATARMREPNNRLPEWAEWAQLAARSARKFETSMHMWLERLDAEIPELRAKLAWAEWTSDDVAKEFAPWPDEPSQ